MIKKYAGDALCLLVCLVCAGVWMYRGDTVMALIFVGGAVAWIGRRAKMAKEPEEKKQKKTKQ